MFQFLVMWYRVYYLTCLSSVVFKIVVRILSVSQVIVQWDKGYKVLNILLMPSRHLLNASACCYYYCWCLLCFSYHHPSSFFSFLITYPSFFWINGPSAIVVILLGLEFKVTDLPWLGECVSMCPKIGSVFWDADAWEGRCRNGGWADTNGGSRFIPGVALLRWENSATLFPMLLLAFGSLSHALSLQRIIICSNYSVGFCFL